MAGHAPEEIAIEFTGLRPGEKLYEEMLADADATVATPIRQLRIARLESRAGSVTNLLRLLLADQTALADLQVRQMLALAVPEYRATTAE
jgi:FlaA1/EpsC-like NDP-sugar epimerase